MSIQPLPRLLNLWAPRLPVLVQAALEKASSIIEKEHTINLTMKSADVFFEAVSNPPEPNSNLA